MESVPISVGVQRLADASQRPADVVIYVAGAAAFRHPDAQLEATVANAFASGRALADGRAAEVVEAFRQGEVYGAWQAREAQIPDAEARIDRLKDKAERLRRQSAAADSLDEAGRLADEADVVAAAADRQDAVLQNFRAKIEEDRRQLQGALRGRLAAALQAERKKHLQAFEALNAEIVGLCFRKAAELALHQAALESFRLAAEQAADAEL